MKKRQECKFIILNNGRISCQTHNQSLIYLFANGKKICQVGEDNLISKLGMKKYFILVNKHIDKNVMLVEKLALLKQKLEKKNRWFVINITINPILKKFGDGIKGIEKCIIITKEDWKEVFGKTKQK